MDKLLKLKESMSEDEFNLNVSKSLFTIRVGIYVEIIMQKIVTNEPKERIISFIKENLGVVQYPSNEINVNILRQLIKGIVWKELGGKIISVYGVEEMRKFMSEPIPSGRLYWKMIADTPDELREMTKLRSKMRGVLQAGQRDVVYQCATCADYLDSTTLKVCSRCRCCWYCSPACQETHWPEHKKVCRRAKKKKRTVNSKKQT